MRGGTLANNTAHCVVTRNEWGSKCPSRTVDLDYISMCRKASLVSNRRRMGATKRPEGKGCHAANGIRDLEEGHRRGQGRNSQDCTGVSVERGLEHIPWAVAYKLHVS